MTKSLTYIEIDVLVCALTYGAAPCMASIPETGAIKCFNTRKTCQDRDNLDEEEVTHRFAINTDYLPRDIDAIPSIRSIDFSPATISLGVDLGQRASLSVTFTDHPHADTLPGDDPYRTERGYNPFEQGTYWGKFRARQPFLRGRAIRWYTGVLGQSLAEMECRHFIIDSFDGPTPAGIFTIVAKDVLKLASGDRSQAPAMSSGFLNADISSGAGTLALQPTGVGDEEYPAAGTAVIGGNEVVTFTRASDTVTLTARGQAGTTATAHNAQDRFQLALAYTEEDPADIIHDLMVNYAGIPAEFIDLTEWRDETRNNLNRVYTTVICEPTAVDKLISEIIEQAALSIWWDDIARKVRLKVLRAIDTDVARFTPDNTLQGSLTTKEQPDKRLSRVQTYFGRINAVKSLTDTDNYRSSSLVIDDDAESDYGTPVIKTIYSRWIPDLGRTVADRVGVIILGRFRDPPRRTNFDLQRYAGTDPILGAGYRVETFAVQDATGARSDIPVQITRLNPQADRFLIEAEEMLFDVEPEDLTNRLIIIDANTSSVNFRTAHDSIYPAPEAGITVTCRINSGVVVGSANWSIPAFSVGDWPDGVTLVIELHGSIRGAGGPGGISTKGNGLPGSAGIYTREDVTLDLRDGAEIWGGGGGGAGGGPLSSDPSNLYPAAGGGGGGAGTIPGTGGWGYYVSGQPGTATAGGYGGQYLSFETYYGGAGGNPGSPGGYSNNSGGGAPGAAGRAIDGVSHVTIVGVADIRGPQVN